MKLYLCFANHDFLIGLSSSLSLFGHLEFLPVTALEKHCNMDDVFLSNDFNPDEALKLRLSPGICDESVKAFEKSVESSIIYIHIDTYLFRRFLIDEDGTLAALILKEDNNDKKIILSKKEGKRQREVNLKNMVKGGR